MKKIRRYCPLLWLCLGMGALVFGLLGYRFLDRKIPDEITVTEENRDKSLLPSIPFLTLEDAIPVSGEGSFCAGVKYLGVIPLKTVKVTEKESTRVYVSGSSVGIYMETEGGADR
ncbi:MAG: hypothetical protein LUG62_08055 [Clostridiales bacterium]|nr:hypothetical protein [Clostridiales bacterium]